MFIDYGNAEVVPVETLESLPEVFFRIRPLATPFRLLTDSARCNGLFLGVMSKACRLLLRTRMSLCPSVTDVHCAIMVHDRPVVSTEVGWE